jgi:hypothetical protein
LSSPTRIHREPVGVAPRWAATRAEAWFGAVDPKQADHPNGLLIAGWNDGQDDPGACGGTRPLTLDPRTNRLRMDH